MKTTCLIFAAAAITASAQTTPNAGIAYQQAGDISAKAMPGAPGPMITIGGPVMGMQAPDGVTGSPFSATEQSHSLQVLGDGTRIERSESQQMYRDSTGRTRVESGQAGTGMVRIQDPVGGFTVILNPSDQTAQKLPTPKLFAPGEKVNAVVDREIGVAVNSARTGAYTVSGIVAGGAMVTARAGFGEQVRPTGENVTSLAPQNINGVMASGRHVSMTIAAGEIGNDRPIQVVSESWYSNDLQMVVKSSNSDPRFGDSSFELTNIVRSEPDPSLFQIPAGYTVTDLKAIKTKVRTKE